MKHHHFSLSLFPLSITFVALQVTLRIPQSLGNTYICRDARFKCGNISGSYPFSGESTQAFCGYPGLRLGCEYSTVTSKGNGGARYSTISLDIDLDHQTLRKSGQDLSNNDSCYPQFRGWNFDNELVNTSGNNANVTLHHVCQNFNQTVVGSFNCMVNGGVRVVSGVVDSSPCYCNVTAPIVRSYLKGNGKLNYSMLLEGLKQGFEVKWNKDSQVCDNCEESACDDCVESGGLCGYYEDPNQRVCYGANPNDTRNGMAECNTLAPAAAPSSGGTQHVPPTAAPNSGGTQHLAPAAAPISGGTQHEDGNINRVVALISGLVGSAISVVLICCIIRFIFGCFKGKQLSNRMPINLWQQKTKNDSYFEAFLIEFGSLAPKRYFYVDIKKMTNKFKDKLGQGGFGSVYKGKLANGRLVAVKVLSESKGNGKDFMNEVASISRTSHVNIVTLLGFCYDKSKRALVYEFMPLGSLDKFIFYQGSRDQSRQLEWKTLYEIAVGIAKGLEYLHQGCNTRILHFDIKPHNILLDENFFPKISDFGLSKLCERKQSVISMTGARGTAGYIAPEVFCRNFGGVSHKSDVYSYGMMVLEMIGGRQNINVEVSKSGEIYFPSWIYKQIDHGMSLSLLGVTTEEEEEITRKLIVVSLWSIQTNPSDRPSMTKVLEMLQGSFQSLIIPPCPFVSSPVRSPKVASTTFVDDP